MLALYQFLGEKFKQIHPYLSQYTGLIVFGFPWYKTESDIVKKV